jgi:uncharacterized membrane protein required for colicin V production
LVYCGQGDRMTIETSLFPVFNLVLIALVVLLVIWGYFKGFLLQLLSFAVWVTIFLVSWLAAPILAQIVPLVKPDNGLAQLPLIGPLVLTAANAVLWFVIIVVLMLLLSLLLRPVLKAVGKIPVLKELNHALGMLFALLKAGLLLAMVTLLLQSPLFANGNTLIEASILRFVMPVTATVSDQIQNQIDPDGVIAKMLDGQPYSTQDTITLESWLSERGLDAELIAPVSKLIRRAALSTEDILAIKTWLEANGFSESDIEDLLTMFKPYD